jgi:vacuolar-type H+-ATPase subunit B/Vma2
LFAVVVVVVLFSQRLLPSIRSFGCSVPMDMLPFFSSASRPHTHCDTNISAQSFLSSSSRNCVFSLFSLSMAERRNQRREKRRIGSREKRETSALFGNAN